MPRKLPFTSSKEEIEHLIQVYKIESEAERNEYKTKMDSLSIPERIKSGATLHPLLVEEVEYFIGDSWKIKLTSKDGFPKYHSFSPGTPISVFRGEERQFSQVTSIRDGKIIILIEGEVPDWLEEGNVGIDLFYSEKTYKEGEKALQRLLEDKEDRTKKRNFILGYSNISPDFIDWNKLKDEKKSTSLEINPAFNESQKQAVQSIITTEDTVVIQGPPGTGKTSVLVEAIRLLVLLGKKVLISTPTNSALDLLLEKSLPLGMNPLRLGQTSRVSEALLPHTLDSGVENHSLTKQINKYKKQAENLRKKATRYHRNFGEKQRDDRRDAWNELKGIKETIRNTERQIENELVRIHNPILATTVAASNPILHKVRFDICILDEATQAIEPLAWIPILRSDKVIIAGDENQLPPTVLSNEEDLLNTLFLKMIDNFRDSPRLCFLDTQYRMEEEILGFSNLEFYNNQVKTDQSVINREKIFSPIFDSPMVFIDTAGTGYEEEKSEESESLRNTGEANLIVQIAQKIIEELSIQPSNIGIIAPYKEQIYAIREASPVEWTSLDISTVDAFQGREKDVILLSLTRSNEEGELGFLKDYRRMNVSLTRARKLLVVIGDSATLSADAFYTRFLDYAQNSGDYRSAYEFIE